MSEEERPDYARLYRKGKRVGKIFEADALSEFRRKGEREEAQEEVRLLKDFNYWWHDTVRLRYQKTWRWLASKDLKWWGILIGAILGVFAIRDHVAGIISESQKDHAPTTESKQSEQQIPEAKPTLVPLAPQTDKTQHFDTIPKPEKEKENDEG